MPGPNDDWIKYRLREGLAPERFEELCFALLEAEGHTAVSNPGAAGADHGVDLASVGPDGRRWVVQCKRVRQFGPTPALAALEEVFQDPGDSPAQVYRLAATCNISTETECQLRRRAEGALEIGSTWALGNLVALLRDRHPDLLPKFIGSTGMEPPTPEHLKLSRQLEKAEEELEALLESGGPAGAVERTIRRLKRRLREGAQLRPGDLLGGVYRLKVPVGQGGFATVWRARHRKTRQVVAVKVLHGQFARDESRRRRFFCGAREMVRLGEHPGIVRVLVSEAQDEGFHYFVMEYFEGGDFLHARLRGRWSEAAALKVILSVGNALTHAHARGIVHRDVKPANIVFDGDGRGKLTDFDLVKVSGDSTGNTRTEAAMGTFVYAAPESLIDAKRVEASADVYSLAMTAIFALRGQQVPHSAINATATVIAPLTCSEALKQVLKRGTLFDPGQRYSTVEEFCAALRHAQEQPALETVPTKPAPSLQPRVSFAVRLGSLKVRVVDSGQDIYGRWETVSFAQVKVRFRWIEPGTFLMGSPEEEPGHFAQDGPQHEVTLKRGFWLAETPTTQAFWQAVSGANPSQFKGKNRPVERVSWNDCQSFLAAVNEAAPELDVRLPAEAEWEYACRAGTTTATYEGTFTADAQGKSPELDVIAWYRHNSSRETHPVAQKRPNAWGLHDMLGNVWEWCHDRWRPDYSSPSEGAFRVIRGGAWSSGARDVRAACRYCRHPSGRFDYLGFRLALGPAPGPAEPASRRAEPVGAERPPEG